MALDVINLDSYMRVTGSLAAKPRDYINPIEYDNQFEAQSRLIKASNVEFKDFITFSGSAFATATVTDGNSNSVTLTAGWLTPFQGKTMFSEIYWAIYLGSVDPANQFYPRLGVSTAPTSLSMANFQIYGPTYDFNRWQLSGSSTANSPMSMRVRNTSGSTVTWIYAAKYKAIHYFTGSAILA